MSAAVRWASEADAPRAMRILAISLDLDDTLWPVEPAILAAEQQLDDWLRRHHAPVAARWPIAALRALRDEISGERPDLAHDYTAQRLLTLERAFAACGIDDRHVAGAFEVYHAARNRIECYADALPALQAIAARLPLVSISNGNADLQRIGLRAHFRHCISARECGFAKPSAAIFHAACALLGLAPGQVLHVGDDPLLDVIGARAAGLRAAWLNRDGASWPERLQALAAHEAVGVPDFAAPEFEWRDLGELARWVEQQEDANACHPGAGPDTQGSIPRTP
jgi:putative hydrolase of the HAD superfamily